MPIFRQLISDFSWNAKLKEIEEEENYEIDKEKESENEEVENFNEQSEVESKDLSRGLFYGWIVSFCFVAMQCSMKEKVQFVWKVR